MRNKVLLSIKPHFVEEIFKGSKRFEYRKAIFKDKNINKVIIYSTMPVGKIVGEFDIECILEEHPIKIWNLTKKDSGITDKFFFEYFDGREKAFAIKIKSFAKYDSPVCPHSLFEDFVAPQSFKYIRY